MKKRIIAALITFPLIAFGQVQVTSSHSGNLEDIMLPKEYKIEIYASGVPNVREMDFAEDGTLFAGSSEAGKVYAIKPDRTVLIVDDSLDNPSGLDYYKGDLYVADVSRILKYENILKTLDLSPVPIVLNDHFPKDGEHGLIFIRIGPDGKLYIPVGSTCDVCVPDSVWHSRIIRMSPDGKELEYYAEGVRDAGGFDWNPATGTFWFTDDGPENIKDNSPPDELNKAIVSGGHFGFPFINGHIMDKDTWPYRPKNKGFISPALGMPARTEPMGICFYTGKMFEKEYQGGIFIAEHGSPDPPFKEGFRVSYVNITRDRPEGYEVFAEGWLKGNMPLGRPADVKVGPDGSLFVSDDLAGCIYRIYR
jgi:glucose/arabinose dehydrogenase